jgi:ribonuclease HI
VGWRRATFKDKAVWAEVDEAGALKIVGGRVSIRYSEREGATVYGAGSGRVTGVNGPAVDLKGGVSADEAPATGSSRSPASKGSGFGSAKTRTAAQAVEAAKAAGELIGSLPPGTIVAFTDGGCKGNPGPAGSGVSLRLPDGRRAEHARSLGRATNNIAELTAVAAALDLLEEASVPVDAPVALLTDSEYTNGVLCKGWKAKANRELILDLRKRLSGRPGVTVYWVAGHAGVDGNEQADALANAGVAGRTFTRWHEA